MTLRKLVEYHNRETSHKLAWRTLKNSHTTQRYIEKFLKEKCTRNNIALSEFNYKFIMDFESYLQKYKPKDRHKPLGNNGVMKHMERLREMVNMAITMDWLEKTAFAKYKLHFDKNESVWVKRRYANISSMERRTSTCRL